MAKSSELTSAIARAIDVPDVSVKVMLRRLREAGMIAVGGRGPYALDMTHRDAVRLILATCASRPLETDSGPRAVAEYEDLECVRIETEGNGGRVADPSLLPLSKLGSEHALGNALCVLLESAGRGSLFPFRKWKSGIDGEPIVEDVVSYASENVFVAVRFFSPLPAVMVQHQIGGLSRTSWSYGRNIGVDFSSYRRDLISSRGGWRLQTTEIGHEALTIVAKCIVGEKPTAAGRAHPARKDVEPEVR